MGQATVNRRWQEYLASGEVTIRASTFKGVMSLIGLLLLATICAGIGYDAFLHEGASSIKPWGCGLGALLALVSIFVAMAPMVRGRKLILTPSGLLVTSRQAGRRITELSLRWENIESVYTHSTTSGEGSTSVDVRMMLIPGSERRYIDLPVGFSMTRKDLAKLIEGIRRSRR